MNPISQKIACDIPFKTISELSPIYKNFVSIILRTLEGVKINYEDNVYNQFISINSPIKEYLYKLLIIAKEQFPLKIHKLTDEGLLCEIEEYTTMASQITSQLNSWNSEIVKFLSVFKETVPHVQPSRTFLQDLGPKYGELYKTSLGFILHDHQKFIQKIKTRIDAYESEEISFKSLELICNSSDATTEYLTKNFDHFYNRTEGFKTQLSSLSKCFETFNASHTCLEKSFNELAKLTEIENIKSYFSSYGKPKKKFIAPPFPNLDKLTPTQDRLICQIFTTLDNKCSSVPSHENTTTLLEDDPYLTPLLHRIRVWTPCHHHVRKGEDDLLLKETNSLIDRIKIEILYFNQLGNAFTLHLLELTPINKINYPHIAHLNGEGVQNYASQNKVLESIAKESVHLMDKLNHRILGDTQVSISSQAFQKMCQTHDSSQNQLQKNFDQYHLRTLVVVSILKELSKALEDKKSAINNFKKAFNYFNYLEKKRLEPSDYNYADFCFWHSLGYYNYIDSSKCLLPNSDQKPTKTISLDIPGNDETRDPSEVTPESFPMPESLPINGSNESE